MATISIAQLPCSSDERYHDLLKEYPQLAEYEAQFEAQLHNKLGRMTATPDTATYDIPLVVHVVHDYGVENISDNIIYDAAAYWATIYMKENPDTISVIPPFVPYIGNPKMRLHLATIDPNGNPTKGIDRIQSYLTVAADDQAKYNDWPSNKYINIWIINKFGAASTGAAAYAYTPGSASGIPYYDGVICLYDYTNYAKTIPHEIGHVLNLKHPWGNTNSPAVACGDDNVDDTPPTKGHLTVGCVAGALFDTTCATGYLKHYTNITGADSIADYPDTVNAENIMDYTYCQKMFTKGQCARMRAALTSTTAGRNNLISPANLAATGALAPMPDLPPVADFTMNKAAGAGIVTDTRSYFLTFNNVGSFVFNNQSWNDTISSASWSFSNGASTPASTSLTTVTNTFSVPGWVTVTLTATSNAGSTTLVRQNAVYAADTTAAPATGYTQWFGSASDVANWPMFNYYNNQFKWQLYNGAGYDDNSCVRYRSFDTSNRRFGTAVGDHDDMFTPAFNLTGVDNTFYLNFFTAGQSTTKGLSGSTTKVNDSLEIDVSITGGTRWVKLAGYSGSNLANNGSSSAEFVPASTQWKARAVSIPATYHNANTFFRFRYWPGNTGNNLYLDNVYFYAFPAGVKEALAASPASFNLFPNPAVNGCTLVFKTGNDGMVNYSIKDITGKLIYQASKEFMPNSIQQESISRSITPSAGMYFITATIDGVNTTQKLVVY